MRLATFDQLDIVQIACPTRYVSLSVYKVSLCPLEIRDTSHRYCPLINNLRQALPLNCALV